MSIAVLNRIPHFISASTPEILQRKMLEMNHINGKEYKWFDIQYVKGVWFAWYLEDVSKSLLKTIVDKKV